MQCQVLLFSELADLAQTRRILLELEAGATVSDALDVIGSQFPAIASRRSVLATAIDEVYCNQSELLSDGCTLALIPPVSGG